MKAPKHAYRQAAEALEAASLCGYVAGYLRANQNASVIEAITEYSTDFDSDQPRETLRSWWYRWRVQKAKG